MNQSLVLSGVSKRFCSDRGGTVEALRDVTLTVPTGRITVLLGPSGCGKSTLLQLIAGFETPDSGRMEQGGRPFSPEGTEGSRPSAEAAGFRHDKPGGPDRI